MPSCIMRIDGQRRIDFGQRFCPTKRVGELLGTLDTSAANADNPAGLGLAPSSGDPDQMSLYMVARGVDNNSDPNENDGMVYEFELLFDDPLMV